MQMNLDQTSHKKGAETVPVLCSFVQLANLNAQLNVLKIFSKYNLALWL